MSRNTPVPTTHLSARQYCHKLERLYVLSAVSSIRVIRKEYYANGPISALQQLLSFRSACWDARARPQCVYVAEGLSVSTKVETAEVTSLFRAHSSGSNVLLNLASAISAFSCTHLSTFRKRAVTKFAQKECQLRRRCDKHRFCWKQIFSANTISREFNPQCFQRGTTYFFA